MFGRTSAALVLAFSAVAAAQSPRVQVDWIGASWWPDCREYAAFVWPLLEKPTFNSIVDFAFWPNQARNLTACTSNNTDAHSSYLCKIDHFEACALSNLGCVGGCHNDTTQRQLFQFLNCFEGEHVKPLPGKDYPGASWLESLEPCATAAGFNYAAIDKCASDVSAGSELSKAFDAITKYVASVPLKYFPWVELDSRQMGDLADTCLESWVCGNYTGQPTPKSCLAKRAKGC